MKEKVVKGDFERFIFDKTWKNIKWLDRLTSCVVSHWDDDMEAIHILYNYDLTTKSYSREICYGATFFSYFKKNGTSIEKEGIDIIFRNTSMDNIKVNIDSVIDMFRKQVLDIV